MLDRAQQEVLVRAKTNLWHSEGQGKNTTSALSSSVSDLCWLERDIVTRFLTCFLNQMGTVP